MSSGSASVTPVTGRCSVRNRPRQACALGLIAHRKGPQLPTLALMGHGRRWPPAALEVASRDETPTPPKEGGVGHPYEDFLTDVRAGRATREDPATPRRAKRWQIWATVYAGHRPLISKLQHRLTVRDINIDPASNSVCELGKVHPGRLGCLEVGT